MLAVLLARTVVVVGSGAAGGNITGAFFGDAPTFGEVEATTAVEVGTAVTATGSLLSVEVATLERGTITESVIGCSSRSGGEWREGQDKGTH